MTIEDYNATKIELKSRKILLKKFESVLKSLNKQGEIAKQKRAEKIRSLREYKTFGEAQEAYGWELISEEEFRDIVEFIEKGDSQIENDLSPHEIAADIVRGYIRIIRSDISSLEFDLLPPEEQDRQRDLAYQRALEREKKKGKLKL